MLEKKTKMSFCYTLKCTVFPNSLYKIYEKNVMIIYIYDIIASYIGKNQNMQLTYSFQRQSLCYIKDAMLESFNE